MKKKLISIILAIAMLACMIPLGMVTAFAETAQVKYLDWDDSSKTLVEKTATAEKMTSSTASLTNGGWYVVDGTVTVNNRIKLASGGTAHIILKDGAKLTASAGIEVDAGQSLYIYGQADGTGALEATGVNYDAGIGGSTNADAGTVIINGGTVTASGGGAAAGIGSAHWGSGGTIIINGGTVTASGNENSPGIGNGLDADGATVTINGGTVTASGGWDGGAGIGGGEYGNGGTVTINGGAVTATGCEGGVGIGGGDNHGTLSINSAATIMAGNDESLASVTTLDDYKSDRNPYIKVVKLAHTHEAGTEWMTDGGAHWLKCADADCPLKTVADYTAAFVATGGDALKTTLQYSADDENGIRAGRQAKLSNKVLGRTIIPVTPAQLAAFGDVAYVTAFDTENNKSFGFTVDCIYTCFYNNGNLIEADGEEVAGYIIIQDDGEENAISGYGYYRILNGKDEKASFIFDCTIAAPAD